MSIRNLVSRNADLIEPILDAGAENLLRNAGKYQVRRVIYVNFVPAFFFFSSALSFNES